MAANTNPIFPAEPVSTITALHSGNSCAHLPIDSTYRPYPAGIRIDALLATSNDTVDATPTLTLTDFGSDIPVLNIVIPGGKY